MDCYIRLNVITLRKSLNKVCRDMHAEVDVRAYNDGYNKKLGVEREARGNPIIDKDACIKTS